MLDRSRSGFPNLSGSTGANGSIATLVHPLLRHERLASNPRCRACNNYNGHLCSSYTFYKSTVYDINLIFRK